MNMDGKGMEGSDERTRILEMVAEGKLKASEASRILEALQASDQAISSAQQGGGAKWLRVRVFDLESGKSKVSVNVPLALADVAMRFIPAETLATTGIDPRSVVAALRNAGPGKILEAVDEDDKQRVEITIE
jgi:hypothetical protein